MPRRPAYRESPWHMTPAPWPCPGTAGRIGWVAPGAPGVVGAPLSRPARAGGAGAPPIPPAGYTPSMFSEQRHGSIIQQFSLQPIVMTVVKYYLESL